MNKSSRKNEQNKICSRMKCIKKEETSQNSSISFLRFLSAFLRFV